MALNRPGLPKVRDFRGIEGGYFSAKLFKSQGDFSKPKGIFLPNLKIRGISETPLGSPEIDYKSSLNG